MRILVISDTHIQGRPCAIPEIIRKEAALSDCCLHCGDFTSYSIYKALSSLTRVYGVCGNMDDKEIREELPASLVVNIEEISIGLTHGSGNPRDWLQYVKKTFAAKWDKISIIFFGHTHCPTDIEQEGKIFFNPGSPTDEVYAPYRSYGIVEINGKKIERRIERLG